MRVRKQHGEQRLCTCPGSKDMAWRRSEQQHGDKILAEHRSCVPAVHRASGAVHHSTYPFAPLHEADLSFDSGPNARATPGAAIFNHKCSHASTTAFVNGAPYIIDLTRPSPMQQARFELLLGSDCAAGPLASTRIELSRVFFLRKNKQIVSRIRYFRCRHTREQARQPDSQVFDHDVVEPPWRGVSGLLFSTCPP